MSCSTAACSRFFCWAMVQTLPWLLISVSLGQPQPDPSVSTCCTASHVVLCRSCCLVFQSCPRAMVCPLVPLQKERKRREQKKKTEENKGNKKEQRKEKKRTWEDSSLQVLVSARMAKEGNATPIGQQVLLLQCVSDVVSMPWWPD